MEVKFLFKLPQRKLSKPNRDPMRSELSVDTVKKISSTIYGKDQLIRKMCGIRKPRHSCETPLLNHLPLRLQKHETHEE